MERKHFLKLLALGGLAPLILPACRRYGPVEEYSGKVIIIGAGAAGLYAAALLKEAGATVEILEASDKVGGRIRELTDFADFPIELGAEEVHGQKSLWYEIVRDSGAKFTSADEDDVFFIDGTRIGSKELKDNADAAKLLELVENFSDYSGSDMTIEDYLLGQSIPVSLFPLANALLGNEFGSSNDRVGTLGKAQEEALWTAGEKNCMVRDRSFYAIISEHFASVIPDVQLNTLVIRIDYSGDQVEVLDATGITHVADKVIVTSSLAALKSNLIQFIPGLPYVKQQAMQKLGMAEGMKVILKFSSQFWPDGTGSIYGAGLVPEWWVTSGGGRGNDFVLTAFVNGRSAGQLLTLGSGMVAAICAELDTIFGGNVATAALVDSHVANWGADPITLGTYSYPLVGGGVMARRELAAPVSGKLYFAGEATHYAGHASTVHGALESAYRAVEEVVEI